MQALFDITGVIAVVATLGAITRRRPVHALLYLIVSLLALAVEFYLLGAEFAAALEVIIYAGAIMVLFLFVVMMLNVNASEYRRKQAWLRPAMWAGPGFLAAALLAELFYALRSGPGFITPAAIISSQQVGAALYGPYVIGVELASLLLLSGLVGAYHLSHEAPEEPEEEEQHAPDEFEHARTGAGGDSVRPGAGGRPGAA